MTTRRVDYLPSIESSVVGLDIETQSRHKKKIDPINDTILSIQVSTESDEYILERNFPSVIPLLVNPQVKKIIHGASFDLSFLNYQLGITTQNIYDTLIIERVLTAGIRVGSGLEEVLARRLGVLLDKSTRDQFQEHQGPLTEEQLAYAAEDVRYLIRLRELQMEQAASLGMGRVVRLENEVVPVVVDMRLTGVGFDRDLWDSYLPLMDEKIQDVYRRMAEYAAVDAQIGLEGGVQLAVNLNSTPQVINLLNSHGILGEKTGKEVLIDHLKRHKPDSTQHRLISDILEYRRWSKMRGSDYPKYVNPTTGRIHSDWNQMGAVTGRFSDKDPNMQNVRVAGKDEPNIRAVFTPAPGKVYVVADYSKQEPGALAQLSGDSALIESTFAEDIYCSVGEKVYGRPIEKGSEERKRAKVLLLAHFYGANEDTLAGHAGISVQEAREFQAGIRRAFPVADKYSNGLLREIIVKGYVSTLLGRRRWFLEAKNASDKVAWKYRNEAMNSPMQGTALDITKTSMPRVHNTFIQRGIPAHIVLVVHDELVIECPKEYAEECLEIVETNMVGAMQEICPDINAKADAAIMDTWGKV